MNRKKDMVLLGLFIVSGLLFSACAALNPNTEGQILSELEARKGEFQKCYESALDRNRDTKGIVGLDLKIDGEKGAVTSSSVGDSTTIGDNEMNMCVANSTQDITLPEPPGVPVEGHYDINFDFE